MFLALLRHHWLLLTLGAMTMFGQAPGRITPSLAFHTRESNEITSLSFTPDGKRLAAGLLGCRVAILRGTPWQEEITLGNPCHGEAVDAVRFSDDGLRLGVAGAPQTVDLLDVSTWKKIRSEVIPFGTVHGAFSPDLCLFGASGYSSDNFRRIFLRSLGRQGPVRTLEGHNKGIWELNFSPAGDFLASASFDGKVILWDVNTGHSVRTLAGHLGAVRAVTFGPDGKYVASGSNDETAKLWETSTGRLVHTFEGHKNAVCAVAFSPDSRWLATGSGDSIRLWDVESGLELFQLECSSVSTITFSSDGRWIAAGGGDGSLRIWHVN